MTANWKITIPVSRSEERSDGLYLIGEASGTERDGHGTQMHPAAIMDFARQISDRVDAGDPIPYIDQHMKVGVLRELGHVMEGAVTGDFHLKVAVKLDESNPAAQFLHNNLQRGKQYGMSIAGDGVDFQMSRDEASGAKVITFMKVVLKEISNTTKPSWVPSLGTVLARSLEEGTDNMPEITAPVVETTAPVVPVVVENSAAPTTETTETPEVTEVERARIAAETRASLLAAYTALGEQLVAAGIELPAVTPVTPETTETPVVENSETGDETVDFNGVQVKRDLAEAIQTYVEKSMTDLKAELATKQTYIEMLESLPAGKVPAPVVRDKFETETTGPDLSKMTPQERLRYGLSGVYGNS